MADIIPDSPTTTPKKNMRRLLGYRALVEFFPTDSLRDSWLFIPESQRHKFRAAVVIQTGKYTRTPKRPDLEFKKGDKILVDGNFGSQDIIEGNRTFTIVSAHDVAAVLL